MRAVVVICTVMLQVCVAGAQDMRKAVPYHLCEIYDCPFSAGYDAAYDDEVSPLVTVRISFSNRIRGHNVSVVWNPAKVALAGDRGLMGPATITFFEVKTGKRHVFTTNYFSMPLDVFPDSLLKDARENHIVDSSLDGKQFIFSYPCMVPDASKPGKKVRSAMPFSFDDVNQDGSEELVFVRVGAGQRSASVYRAYEMRCHDKHTMIDYHDRIDGEAACYVDLAEFDKKNRTMTRMYSGGAANNSWVRYKWVEATSTMESGMRELLPVRLSDMDMGESATYVITRMKKKVASNPEGK